MTALYAGQTEDLGRLNQIMHEMAQRRVEALRLYEPLPISQAFHEDMRLELLARGANRSSKTMTCACECARIVTGQDPFQKLPPRDGRVVIVAKDLKTIGRVIWKKLGRFGAFKIIRDEVTGAWRNYRPWTDSHRARESRPSPPLIPERYIQSVLWESKGLMAPSQVKLTTGWEIWFFSGNAAPPPGFDAHLAWFDEEIENSAWFGEVSARLVDNNGRFMWSACPQAATEELFELHLRAGLEGEDSVGEHVFLLADNPYIPEAAKLAMEKKLSPAERRVRIDGEFALTGYRVFPEYDAVLHHSTMNSPPPDWTLYASIDPGRQVCAVIFVAIGPPNDKGQSPFFAYDELYIRNCNAVIFGEQFAQKCRDRTFEAFLIDHQGARQHDSIQGLAIEEQYSEQLKKHKIASRRTGHDFAWGTTDQRARNESFRTLLHVREDNKPLFQVPKDGLKYFEQEIRFYHHRRQPGSMMATDEVVKKNDHLMDCVSSLAHYRPRYIPRQAQQTETGAVVALRWIEQEFGTKKSDGGISLGPRNGGKL